MYSAVDGVVQEWHHTHLAQFASGGAGLVVAEATAVVPEGRISPLDVGLWNDEQRDAWAPIVEAIHARGAAAGIQLAHAGRKASTWWPWADNRGSVPASDGGWTTTAPSPVAFDGFAPPEELDSDGIDRVVDAVRASAGDAVPVFVRISATDHADGGFTEQEAAVVAGWATERGADLIDVSSGGLVAHQKISVFPGYQVPLASTVRQGGRIPVSAVGLITAAEQAEQVLAQGSADAIFAGREWLRDPHFALRAAHELGAEVAWPPQYERAHWH
jgi:2,4-dienoyl-CoA reductase-like NADH-dependent reductase (Old Yellow Enzyme family)